MRPFQSKLILVIAILFTGGFGFLMSRTLIRERQLQNRVASLEAEIAKAEEKNRELAQLVDYFSKPEHLEKEARMRLNLKKPGEEVLVLPADPEPLPTATSTPPKIPPYSIAAMKEFFLSLLRDY